MFKYIFLYNFMNQVISVPDDNNTNIRSFVLDPLSVIIKLAIISNKPVGTKIRIYNNIIYLQEPGPFQAICRYVLKNNKSEIQYLYNPIEIACQKYLKKNNKENNKKMKDLFKCSQNGIIKLIETYKTCSIMRICLNYYWSLISNYLDEKNDETLFKKDTLTPFYTNEIIDKLDNIWTPNKITIVLNLTNFLSNDNSAESNVKSLETIMEGMDKEMCQILQ